MPSGLSPGSQRPAMAVLLVALSTPVLPSLGAGLALDIKSPVASDSYPLDMSKSLVSGAGATNLESSIPHDPEIATPETLPSTQWPWLSIPVLSLWLWWLLAREAKISGVSQAPLGSSPTSTDAAESQGYAQSQQDGNSQQQPDRPDWVRLTSHSGELQAEWKISAARRLALRQQGGRRLVLRLYSDVLGLNVAHHATHCIQQQYECSEQAQSLTLQLPAPDRDPDRNPDRSYRAELGYLTPEGRWLRLAYSAQSAIHLDPGVDSAQPVHFEADSKSVSRSKASQYASQYAEPVKQPIEQQSGWSNQFWLEPLMMAVIAFLWVLTTVIKLLTAGLSFCGTLLDKSQTPNGQKTF